MLDLHVAQIQAYYQQQHFMPKETQHMLYFLLMQMQAHCQGEGNITRARFPSIIISNQIDNNNIVEQKKSSTTSSPNTSTFPIRKSNTCQISFYHKQPNRLTTILQTKIILARVRFTHSTNTSTQQHCRVKEIQRVRFSSSINKSIFPTTLHGKRYLEHLLSQTQTHFQ